MAHQAVRYNLYLIWSIWLQFNWLDWFTGAAWHNEKLSVCLNSNMMVEMSNYYVWLLTSENWLMLWKILVGCSSFSCVTIHAHLSMSVHQMCTVYSCLQSSNDLKLREAERECADEWRFIHFWSITCSLCLQPAELQHEVRRRLAFCFSLWLCKGLFSVIFILWIMNYLNIKTYTV